jgi:RNA polymerase sigma-70 factor (ECF subfamily)
MRPIADEDLARTLDAHRHELGRYCRRVLGSAADADDAVQETMIRAWRRYDRFEHRASVRTWLYRIATNICLDEVHNRSRRPAPVHVEVEHVALTPTQVPKPDEAVVDAEDVRSALLAAITHLPPRQRAALVLYDVFRWPARDVAALLGTSCAGVTSAVQRARETMAKVPSEDGVRRAATDDQARLLRHYLDAFARYDVAPLATLELAAC